MGNTLPRPVRGTEHCALAALLGEDHRPQPGVLRVAVDEGDGRSGSGSHSTPAVGSSAADRRFWSQPISRRPSQTAWPPARVAGGEARATRRRRDRGPRPGAGSPGRPGPGPPRGSRWRGTSRQLQAPVPPHRAGIGAEAIASDRPPGRRRLPSRRRDRLPRRRAPGRSRPRRRSRDGGAGPALPAANRRRLLVAHRRAGFRSAIDSAEGDDAGQRSQERPERHTPPEPQPAAGAPACGSATVGPGSRSTGSGVSSAGSTEPEPIPAIVGRRDDGPRSGPVVELSDPLPRTGAAAISQAR